MGDGGCIDARSVGARCVSPVRAGRRGIVTTVASPLGPDGTGCSRRSRSTEVDQVELHSARHARLPSLQPLAAVAYLHQQARPRHLVDVAEGARCSRPGLDQEPCRGASSGTAATGSAGAGSTAAGSAATGSGSAIGTGSVAAAAGSGAAVLSAMAGGVWSVIGHLPALCFH